MFTVNRLILDKIKRIAKLSPFLVTVWRKGSLYRHYGSYFPQLNIHKTFPTFLPSSGGQARQLTDLTILSINQTFPFLASLLKSLNVDHPIETIEEFVGEENINQVKKFKELFDQYGSDKANIHNYHRIYASILKNTNKELSILEIGLGTNNSDVASNMGLKGKPGASLRAFKDFLPLARIFGADVDKRILFTSDRIETFYVDQIKPETFNNLRDKLPSSLDLVIDDGLHSPNANIATLEFGLSMIKINGWVIVEDIRLEALDIWKVISALLVENYKVHIIKCQAAYVFAVNRLR